jgi:hypothetical protein
MSAEDAAVRWGLPPGFMPARFPIADDVKDLIRDMLEQGEPVIVTLANEGNSISLVATSQRVFSIRSGLVAGVTGYTVREFPGKAYRPAFAGVGAERQNFDSLQKQRWPHRRCGSSRRIRQARRR